MWVGFIYKTAGREGKAKAVDSTGVLVLVVGGISFFVFFLYLFSPGLGCFWGVGRKEKKRKVGRQ